MRCWSWWWFCYWGRNWRKSKVSSEAINGIFGRLSPDVRYFIISIEKVKSKLILQILSITQHSHQWHYWTHLILVAFGAPNKLKLHSRNSAITHQVGWFSNCRPLGTTRWSHTKTVTSQSDLRRPPASSQVSIRVDPRNLHGGVGFRVRKKMHVHVGAVLLVHHHKCR